MNTPNHAVDAERLLTQASERMSEFTQLAPMGEGGLAWFLEFENNGGFMLEWSADWSRLVLIADLGVPPSDGEIATLNLALSYNALWRDIGDLRIARDGDEGELLLIGELGPDDVAPETFEPALRHFDSLRRWWIDAIERSGEDTNLPPIDHNALLGRI